MSIGAGIALIVIGAILTFALNGDLGGGIVDLTLIGYILMGAGVIVTLIGAIFTIRKRKTVTSTTVQGPDGLTATRKDTVKTTPPQY